MCPLVAFVSEVVLFCKQNDIKKGAMFNISLVNLCYIRFIAITWYLMDKIESNGQTVGILHKDTTIKISLQDNKYIIRPMSQVGSLGKLSANFTNFTNFKQSWAHTHTSTKIVQSLSKLHVRVL